MPRVAASPLSCLQTSKPLSFGIIMSSRIRSGFERRDLVERVAPVDRHGRVAVEAG